MTPREILIKARELISKPEQWNQGCMARNKDNQVVHSYSDDAVRWCAIGAIRNIVCSNGYVGVEHLLIHCIPDDYKPYMRSNATLAEFNDDKTHKEVLGLFDKAIELAL